MYNRKQTKSQRRRFGPQRRMFLKYALDGDHAAFRSALQDLLRRDFDIRAAYSQILIPLLQDLGDAWAQGSISIAQEHIATEVVGSELSTLRAEFPPSKKNARKAIFATLPGDLHSLGPRIVADFFLMEGWKVSFLGANTPPAEILKFARLQKSDLIGLSVFSAEKSDEVRGIIRKLHALPHKPKVMLGGRGAAKFTDCSGTDLADAFPASAEDAVVKAQRLMTASPSAFSLADLACEVGIRIKTERSRRAMSQAQLARSAQIDRAYLSVIENGKHNITIGALLQIANALGVSLEKLVARGSPDTCNRISEENYS